jgi:hypothetical protein
MMTQLCVKGSVFAAHSRVYGRSLFFGIGLSGRLRSGAGRLLVARRANARDERGRTSGAAQRSRLAHSGNLHHRPRHGFAGGCGDQGRRFRLCREAASGRCSTWWLLGSRTRSSRVISASASARSNCIAHIIEKLQARSLSDLIRRRSLSSRSGTADGMPA